MSHWIDRAGEMFEENIAKYGAGTTRALMTPDYYHPLRLRRARKLMASLPEASTIVDVGCGNGPLIPWLPPNISQYVGIDPNEKFLAAAKEKYPTHHFELAGLGDGRFRAEYAVCLGVSFILRPGKEHLCWFVDELRKHGSRGFIVEFPDDRYDGFFTRQHVSDMIDAVGNTPVAMLSDPDDMTSTALFRVGL